MNPPIPSPSEASTREMPHLPQRAPLTLHVCGINQERANISVRELFAIGPERCAKTLERIKAEGFAPEAMVLSTCNRTEIYAFSPLEEAFGEELRKFFLSLSSKPLDPAHSTPLYDYEGQEAVRHYFAVESGLDSMILGENEIKAQVRQAYEMSRTAGLAGPSLHRLIDAGHRCSKRIRTETDLNAGTLSVGRAAVLHAEQIIGSLETKTCVVIGTGKVGRVAAEAIAERRPARLVLVNRTIETAREIAKGLNAEAVSIPEMAPAIQVADVILGAAFAPNFLVTRKMFEAIRGKAAEGRRVCLIDAAVPRILDHEIGDVPGVLLFDISHLEGIIAENRAKRTAAAQSAWELVEREVEKFKARQAGFSLGPAVERLQAKFDELFEESASALGGELSGEGLARAREAQRKLKQRLFHAALQEIKICHAARSEERE